MTPQCRVPDISISCRVLLGRFPAQSTIQSTTAPVCPGTSGGSLVPAPPTSPPDDPDHGQPGASTPNSAAIDLLGSRAPRPAEPFSGVFIETVQFVIRP